MYVCVGDRVLRLINLFPCAVPVSTLAGSNSHRKLQDTIKSANKIASEVAAAEEKEIEGNSKNVCECKRCRKYSTINNKRHHVGDAGRGGGWGRESAALKKRSVS